MAVAFAADGAVGTITLDNPPANSYDLGVMREFGAAVDDAIASGARVVVVRSASPKFFSAGADVDGDVDASMEMIRTSQAAFRRMAAAPQVLVAHIAGGQLPLDRGLALEQELIEELFRSKDVSEGLNAFVEKRTPEFVGA